ncbi:hypothetical protein SAMN06295967_1282 [Belliella buryatensis]|uniref:Uncharacterized protein n=2 Tax=Belliella buryatensis TaxID=1500549 RepID=A0A239HAM9_9BACT|nr:hypothetical protein SAMN06295967_1282 [Belliella buryatensis]
MILYCVYKFVLNMINVLIIEAYESYKNNLVEYFELRNCRVFSLDRCGALFISIPDLTIDLVICDFDQEFEFGLNDFRQLIKLDFIKSSYIFLLSTKFKSLSEIFELKVYHDQMYLIEGKRLSDIGLLINRLGM